MSPGTRRIPYAGLVARSVLLGVMGAACSVDAAARDTEGEPVGVFICQMYGSSIDQRFYLSLAPDGLVQMSRVAEADEGVWRPLGSWRRERRRIEFVDRLNGRLFTADLRSEDLGGTWLGVGEQGGWWCALQPFRVDREPPTVDRLMQALTPAIMASPIYPRQAIREALEGRTVTCFIVTGTGEIKRPNVVESTNDVFREPTLVAVEQSLYRSWGDEAASLPACRSFTFELSAVR